MSEQSYAGDVDARAAWTILAEESRSVLVDVRTHPEWVFVGLPDLTELRKQPVLVPWQVYPSMQRNADFVAQIEAAGVERDTPLLFLCRSGGRSRSAAVAMTAAGFTRCYNVAGGFEGPLDDEGHRGATDGWKAHGLPWRQQ